MHGFLNLAPLAALLLGQVPPASPPSEPASAGSPGSASAPAAAPEPAPTPDEAPSEPAPGAPAKAPAAAPAQAEPPARPAESERVAVARAALAFLDALLAHDAAAVASASSDRFSFDGEVRTGRDEVRRTWRALLAERDPAQRGTLLDLEVLPAADAVARLGPPPPKLAPLASARGTWVAIANVSRRPVVLFLAREGGRWAVVGIE
jgi:ketosteroid isomerase-like protein